MQIMDFLRGRWLVLAAIAPIVAGVMAYAIIASISNERYEAEGWVGVTQALVGEPTQQGLSAALDTFAVAVGSARTVEAVGDATGLSTAEASSALGVRPVAADLVSVSFEAADAATATEGLDVAVRTTLAQLAERSLRRAQFEAATVAETLETASARVAELEDQVGVSDITSQHGNLSGDILNLRNQVATASVTDGNVAAALRAVLAQKQAERAELGAVLSEYQRAAAQQARAADEAIAAQGRVNTLERLLAEIGSGEVLTSAQVEEVSATATVLRATLAAMAGAFAVVLAAAVVRNRPAPGPVAVEDRAAA